MSITCPKCDSSIILNGPVRRIRCNACQNYVNISTNYWKDIFKDTLEWVLKDLKEGEGYNLMKFGEFNTKWSVTEIAPKCKNCEKVFDLKKINPNESSVKCTHCGKQTSVTSSPKWLEKEFSVVEYFIDAQIQEEGESHDPIVSGGIALTCPQCGGSLIIDGKDRLVPCKYCEVNVYLPDDLWLRLHPVHVKSTWFVIYDENIVNKMDFE